jgi:hypothetical protein
VSDPRRPVCAGVSALGVYGKIEGVMHTKVGRLPL